MYFDKSTLSKFNDSISEISLFNPTDDNFNYHDNYKNVVKNVFNSGENSIEHDLKSGKNFLQNMFGSSGASNQSASMASSQIPPSQKNQYILKSKIVPPVCPACPAITGGGGNTCCKKERPCPPCARCPEPAFDCKKVPNYNSTNTSYLPKPLLNDFSQFR